MNSRRHIVVFSGGSAANNLVDVFGKLAQDQGASLSYIIPISDNGGSSSELIRVFGGPGIGDVRSRLVRLIPSSPSTPASQTAIKILFNHRLPTNPTLARIEWLDLVEARHPLWASIPSEKRELIRSFLNTINLEIVKRSRPSSGFNFQSASVGNLFLTGARLFTGSFEAAIYLLGSITRVPDGVSVIPVINSNFSHHISAGLEDGSVITGQNAISHPSDTSATAPPTSASPYPNPSTPSLPPLTPTISLNPSNSSFTSLPLPIPTHLLPRSPSSTPPLPSPSDHEDATPPFSLPTLSLPSIAFTKTHTTLLPSRISRIWYINPYGQEIRPSPNPKVLNALDEASCVIYSIGSLYTSIVPCLVLRGVGEGIASSGVGQGMGNARCKVLILNGSLDRETRAAMGGVGEDGLEKGECAFTAKDFIAAIARACAYSRGGSGDGGEVDESEWREYVTHVVHLQGEGTPRVEKEELRRLGIETARIYGRRVEGEDGEGGMVYDGNALGQALEAVLGRERREGRWDRSRRNTLGE